MQSLDTIYIAEERSEIMILRAKYYGANDMTIGSSLQQAEIVIKSFNPASPESGINDILEYYNIVCFFDNKQYLSSWDEATIASYKATITRFRTIIESYFQSIQGKDLTDLYEHTEALFKEDFVACLHKYKVISRITPEQFSLFIENKPEAMGQILKDATLVRKYGQVIAQHLVNNVRFAELVLRHYYARSDNSPETYMPDELSINDRKNIIEKYVKWDQASIGYLLLISKQRKPVGFRIDDRIRLRAQRRTSQIWNERFGENQNTMTFGVEILFCDQECPVQSSMNSTEMVETIRYSRQWLSENLDYPTLLNNFIYLFFFTDIYFRCEFLSKEKELSVIERLMGVHGNNEYPVGVCFRARNMRSTLQMIAYQHELRTHAIEIESLFKWFFEDYLKQEFGIENYCYFAPSTQASDLEKIVLIASQIEAVLKQYGLYVENKTIDQELVEFSSSTLVDIPSLIEKKYVYSNGRTMQNKLFYLFSDQSALGSIEKTKVQYNTLVGLLKNEHVGLSDFATFQQNNLRWLIERGVIYVDEFDCLRVPNPLINLLYDLYQNESIAYAYLSNEEKKLIDSMIDQGELVIENKLFTRQEQAYFNYMLNARQYNNGLELRNKYVHGAIPKNLERHQQDYVEMLKIMTLIVIKINEEFCLTFPSQSQ